MGRTIAYTALHYGRDFLSWALRSVDPCVDEIHILYSPKPSYGHHTDQPCPEREDELMLAAGKFTSRPVIWHRGEWNGEGTHREEILKIAERVGADTIVWVDADEVWDPATLKKAIEVFRTRPERECRVRFAHFWKSFNRICLDPCMPVRLIRPQGNGTWYLDPQAVPVLHFGYCIRLEIMKYKWAIHGHKPEFKPGWIENCYAAWKPGMSFKDGLHPTCGCNEHGVPFWTDRPTPEELKPILQAQLYDHPYFGLENVG